MGNTVSAAEVRQKVMEFLSCPEEAKEYIQSIPEGILCEWMYFCILDGMPLEDLKPIYETSVISRNQKVHMLRQKRQKFLQNQYMDTEKINRQMEELYQGIKDFNEKIRSLQEMLDSNMKQVSKVQEESLKYQNHSTQVLLHGKDEIIRERDKKILELKARLQEWEEKEEQKNVLQKAEERGSLARRLSLKRRKRAWFFGKDFNQVFIRKYLENESYDEAQKEFLISCLEQGDTAVEMEQYAVPSLSVSMMDRLRKLVIEHS